MVHRDDRHGPRDREEGQHLIQQEFGAVGHLHVAGMAAQMLGACRGVGQHRYPAIAGKRREFGFEPLPDPNRFLRKALRLPGLAAALAVEIGRHHHLVAGTTEQGRHRIGRGQQLEAGDLGRRAEQPRRAGREVDHLAARRGLLGDAHRHAVLLRRLVEIGQRRRAGPRP